MKNPHLEIERKFLIDTLPRGLHRYPHKEIAQGYLAVGRDGAHVRLRRAGRACHLPLSAARPARGKSAKSISGPSNLPSFGRPRPELA